MDERAVFATVRASAALTAVVLLAAAMAAPGGSVAGRALLVAAVGAGAVKLAAGSERADFRRREAALAALMVAIGLLHVLATSRFVATLYDAHMTPSWLLPSGTTRLVVAWLADLLWSGTLAAVAVGRSRLRMILLGAAALLPLVTGAAFPTDAYWLLWDTSTFGSWPYSVGAGVIAVLLAWDVRHWSQRSGGRSEIVDPTVEAEPRLPSP